MSKIYKRSHYKLRISGGNKLELEISKVANWNLKK